VLAAFAEERLNADIAPLPITEQNLVIRRAAEPAQKVFWMREMPR
jgi:hypothetical protein